MLLALGPGLDTPPAAATPRGDADDPRSDGAPSDPWERLAWVAAGEGE